MWCKINSREKKGDFLNAQNVKGKEKNNVRFVFQEKKKKKKKVKGKKYKKCNKKNTTDFIHK